MSGLNKNFIRRIEKLVDQVPTVPEQGTNHIDDTWINSDIYPGELAINLNNGALYTTDGVSLLELNKENCILSGLILKKDTSGFNKLTITSGTLSINSITYAHLSSGTDYLIPINTGSNSRLYFIYGVTTNGVYGTASDGILTMGLTSTYLEGTLDIDGVFNSIAYSENVPSEYNNSILLGAVLQNVGASGNELWPISVSTLGDYYPKKSFTPSEFLRYNASILNSYKYHSLYLPTQLIIDNDSNTVYLSKKMFVSSYTNINDDILNENIVVISGGGGSGGSYTSLSLTGGEAIYKATVGTQFQFKSLTASYPITVSSNSNTVSIGFSSSGFITGLTNVGNGAFLYQGLTSNTISAIRALTAGSSNITITQSSDFITLDVPYVGTTAQGVNLGSTASADIYAGMTGINLAFRRLAFGTGMTGTQNSNSITISTTIKNNSGINVGSGPGSVYTGMSGDNLVFRSLTGSGIITVTTAGNIITIGASSSATASAGVNIGATSGRIYAGMTGSNLSFRSIIPGSGINVTEIGNNVQLDVTVLNGAQGFRGFQGFQGFQGPIGFQGVSGANGTNGTNGSTGSVGPQGPIGTPGLLGPQGFPGPQGEYGPTGTQGLFGGDSFEYIFSTSTTDSDPGAGYMRLSIAQTGASGATGYIYLASYAVNTGGTTLINNWIEALSNSTSSIKGRLRFLNKASSLYGMDVNITGNVIGATGYYKIPISTVQSLGAGLSNNDSVFISYSRTGDIGTTGPQGPIGSSASLGYSSFTKISGATYSVSLSDYIIFGLGGVTTEMYLPSVSSCSGKIYEFGIYGATVSSHVSYNIVCDGSDEFDTYTGASFAAIAVSSIFTSNNRISTKIISDGDKWLILQAPSLGY